MNVWMILYLLARVILASFFFVWIAVPALLTVWILKSDAQRTFGLAFRDLLRAIHKNE